jgi:glucose-6-phosphate isomerase
MAPVQSTPAWRALRAHRESMSTVCLRELFAAEPGRGPAMTVEHDGIVMDYAKNVITAETVDLLVEVSAAYLRRQLGAGAGGGRSPI